MKTLFKWIVRFMISIGGIAFTIKAMDERMIIQRYKFYHPAIDTTIKAMIISDLHSNQYGENQVELMHNINVQQPDIVLLVGDIIDDVLPVEHAEHFLKQVGKQYPTYYVTGNHEHYTNKSQYIKQMIESYGITVLSGKTVQFTHQHTRLQISGMDDLLYESLETQLARSIEQQINEASVKILLAHRPEYIETYLTYGFDIVISGHAHGGQWRVPGLINGVYAPGQGLFPEYAGGHYDMGKTQFYVSRGLETQKNHVPRIFNPPEIVLLEMMKDE